MAAAGGALGERLGAPRAQSGDHRRGGTLRVPEARAAPDGTFGIPHVLPGTYRFGVGDRTGWHDLGFRDVEQPEGTGSPTIVLDLRR